MPRAISTIAAAGRTARPTTPRMPGSRPICPASAGSASDPTNDILAAERHIRTAVGRDYADVPPTRGTYKAAPKANGDRRHGRDDPGAGPPRGFPARRPPDERVAAHAFDARAHLSPAAATAAVAAGTRQSALDPAPASRAYCARAIRPSGTPCGCNPISLALRPCSWRFPRQAAPSHSLRNAGNALIIALPVAAAAFRRCIAIGKGSANSPSRPPDGGHDLRLAADRAGSAVPTIPIFIPSRRRTWRWRIRRPTICGTAMAGSTACRPMSALQLCADRREEEPLVRHAGKRRHRLRIQLRDRHALSSAALLVRHRAGAQRRQPALFDAILRPP